MQSDPLSQFAPGQVSPFVASARTGNAVLEAARDVRRLRYGKDGAEQPVPQIERALKVWVRNDTGADLDAFSAVRIANVDVDVDTLISAKDDPHAFAQWPIFSGLKPVSYFDFIGVTEAPIPYQQIGEVVISGIAVCDIDITDASFHFHAMPVADSTQLKSCKSGPVRIMRLYPPATTGVRRAVVMIDQPPTPGSGDGLGAMGNWQQATATNVIGSDNTWTSLTTGWGVTLPEPGYYFVRFHALAFAEATGTLTDAHVAFRLFNTTAGTHIQDTVTHGVKAVSSGVVERRAFGIITGLSVGVPTVIDIQGFRNVSGLGPTWTSAGIMAIGLASGGGSVGGGIGFTKIR